MADIPISKLIIDFSVDDLPWEEGRFLYGLWLEKISDEKIPARSDFTPFELRSILPNVTLLDIPENIAEISYRLVGSYITTMMQADHTGKRVVDVTPSKAVLKRVLWQLEHKKPYVLTKVVPEWSKIDYRDYNILALPLASDGVNVDMVMALSSPYDHDD